MDWSTLAAVALGGVIAALSPLTVEYVKGKRDRLETKRVAFAAVVGASTEWVSAAAVSLRDSPQVETQDRRDLVFSNAASTFAKARLVCDKQTTDIALVELLSACSVLSSAIRTGTPHSNKDWQGKHEAFITQARVELSKGKYAKDTISIVREQQTPPLS